MDVRIVKEEKVADEDYIDFSVTINNNNVIRTVVTDEDNEDTVAQWIRYVQRLYRRNKNLVVSILGETSTYHEGSNNKLPPKNRIDKLLLFTGSHCLLIDPDKYSYSRMKGLKALKSFLLNPSITFVGMEIDNVVKVLEEDKNLNLHVTKTIDLCALVEHVLVRDDLGRYDVEKLAKLVLGEMYGIPRPNHDIKWYTGYYNNGPINPEKVKFSTFDAFLSYQTAVKCIDMMRRNSYTGNKNASSSSS